MKITIENHGETISHDLGREDVTVVEVLRVITSLLIAAGFAEGSIKQYFADEESPLEWDI